MDFSRFKEWLELKSSHLFAIAFCSGVLLFAPDNFLSRIGLIKLADNFRSWIGGAFLLSTVLLLTRVLRGVTAPLRAWMRKKLFIRRKSRYLHDLTPEEKEVLRGFIENDTKTRSLSMMDGNVTGLANHDVIYRSSSLGHMGGYFAYNIQPWAWEYLRENPELLE